MVDSCQHIIEVATHSNTQIDSLLMAQNSRMDTILTNLSTIITDGTDYSPDIKAFAIPLIIGIFTVMGTLIFAIVNRIDNKYSARQFTTLFGKSCSIWAFAICSILCIITIIAYASSRKSTGSAGWNVAFYVLAISLFISAVLILIRALKFNNPQKLLSIIFSKYGSGLCHKDKRSNFYLLCTQLAHYSIVHDIVLLHDFVNQYVNNHILRVSDFSEELYSSIINIASDYKEKEDDPEVNAELANLFASLVNSTPDGYTKQDTYNALFQTLYICNRNKHYSLINRFQRIMRYDYQFIVDNAQTNRNERANRLRLFVLTFNALLYGVGSRKCIDDAIINNYDAVIIGNATIIPQTSNQSLDYYCYLRELLMDGKEFAYYFYVATDLTSYTRSTLLNRYFAGFFAYLINKLPQSRLLPEDLQLSAYIKERNINYGFDELLRQAPNSLSRTYIKNLVSSYWECRHEIIKNTQINNALCEKLIAEQIDVKEIIATVFKGIVTNNPIYMRDATDIVHPIFEKNGISRVSLLEASIENEIHFYEKYDFGSRAIECIMDALAEVYNSFERIEETIHRNEIKRRWLDMVSNYDYSFLTFHVNIPHRVIPAGEKFSRYFPNNSIIAIRVPDLPYLEWSKDCRILSISTHEMAENNSPRVNMRVDLHMNIHYKKDTIVHVLKVIE